MPTSIPSKGQTTHLASRAVTGLAVLLIGLGMSGFVHADPFQSCPSKAFLVQDTVAKLYGVNLATGYYRELSSDMGTSSKLNAIGFNFHDDYLYAWSYEYGTLVRINSDFQVEPLQVANLPTSSFYVGDVAVDRNVYYFYRPGSSYGLYSIALDASGGLQAERVIDGGSLNLAIYDIAFHPHNTLAYAVDRRGVLYEIDAQSGAYQVISNVGEEGTFGAAYFDVDGYLYISRNQDGYVFQIDLTVDEPIARFYAYGPSSSNNDGARCAMAPIVDEDALTIDFGDAPDSYGTTLSENGARHDLENSSVFLGRVVDGESDAFLHPLSDDSADNSDDDDGIQFITGLELGENAIVSASVSEPAYLNAWIDWNHDGRFDEDEQVLHQEFVNGGLSYLTIPVPVWARNGSTWARFRVSSTADVGPTGGVSDGEVEDYQVSVTAAGVSETVYPGAGAWATVAYEDNWPLAGDYDMNDLVVRLRTRELSRADVMLGIEIEGEIAAVGGEYHNGFAIRLQGIDAATVSGSAVEYWINDRRQTASPLESTQGEAIFIVTDDVWRYVSPGEGCNYHRTESGCEAPVEMRFKLRVAFFGGSPANSFPEAPYDPFLFATPGFEHGYLFAEPPGRGLEVHLPGRGPTARFESAYLGLGDDASDAANGNWFRNANGMPWALELGYEWDYPLEYIDITNAYPGFEPFVTSAGESDGTWYLPENAQADRVFNAQD